MADRTVFDVSGTPVAIREVAGREGTDAIGANDSAMRRFLCKGSSDPDICRQALLAQTFYTIDEYDGLFLNSLSRELFSGADQWLFECGYTNAPKVAGYTVSIDTTGGLAKITDAYQQQGFPAAGQTAPNFGTSIDVQDGKANGVDVIIPALKLTINAKIAAAWVNSPIAYAKLVASVTGRTNLQQFLTFAPGELLFAGATGDIITDKEPTLSFTFIASANVQGGTIGSIQNVTKAGHDYIWFSFRDLPDPAGTGIKVQTPRAAYVSRVYGQVNLAQLKIGEPAPAP